MKLKDLPHDFVLREGELSCADGQNPRHRPLIDRSDVSLHVQTKPWYGSEYSELMAKYKDDILEINLCEACYEHIICKLLTQ